MKISIELDCDSEAFRTHPYEELHSIFQSLPNMVVAQLMHSVRNGLKGDYICLILDRLGRSAGTLRIGGRSQEYFRGLKDRLEASNNQRPSLEQLATHMQNMLGGLAQYAKDADLVHDYEDFRKVCKTLPMLVVNTLLCSMHLDVDLDVTVEDEVAKWESNK